MSEGELDKQLVYHAICTLCMLYSCALYRIITHSLVLVFASQSSFSTLAEKLWMMVLLSIALLLLVLLVVVNVVVTGDGVVCVIFNTHFVALWRCTASSKLSQTSLLMRYDVLFIPFVFIYVHVHKGVCIRVRS